jgi:hypothetical protein
MTSKFWRTCVAASLCLVLLGAHAVPASAAPNGKTSTYEIVTGAAAVYNGLKLLVDNANANKSGREAEHFMNWRTRTAPDVAVSSDPKTDVSTLLELRAILIRNVHDAPRNQAWRQPYEALRTCWNQFVFAKAPAAKTIPTPTATGGAAPAGGSTPAPAPTSSSSTAPPLTADCTTGVQWTKLQDDELDTKDAFASAPTLYQQILDAKVGTYVPQNEVRADILYLQSYYFLRFYFPNTSVPPPSATQSLNDVFSFYKSCIGGTDISGCLTALQGAETGAASFHRAKVACGFARNAWLPTVTLVTREPAVVQSTDFGAVPGC